MSGLCLDSEHKGIGVTQPLATARSLHSEALELFESGKRAEAVGRCREAFQCFEAACARPSPRAAFTLCAIGFLFERGGSCHEAEKCAVRALAMIDSLAPERDSLTVTLLRLRTLTLLGTALRQLGEYARAEQPLTRALEITQTLPDRPEDLANAWNNLGMLCKYAGWFDRGEHAYAQALEAASRQTCGSELITAVILHNIGGIRHSRGRFHDAEEPARQAWEIRGKLLGEDDIATLADATAYAAVLDGLGRYAESRPIYEHALEIYERILGSEHYEVASVLHNLALVEQAQGNRPLAAVLARRAWQIKRKLLGGEHPDTALSAMNLASLRMNTSPGESAALLQHSLAVLEHALAAGHPHIALCRRLIARSLR